MARVEIYKLQNDGTQQVIAVCKEANGVVLCEGNEKLTERLTKEGIIDYSQDPPKPIFPANGKTFLEQLPNNFKSGYLNAEIKEE